MTGAVLVGLGDSKLVLIVDVPEDKILLPSLVFSLSSIPKI